MIKESKKLIECRTSQEGNRIYWERALPHIETIVKACGVGRSSQKPWRFTNGNLYYRDDDRDRVGFGRYFEDKFERGLLAFEEYIINESDLIPQGSPEIKGLEIDEVFNDLSSDVIVTKTYTTSQSFTVTESKGFNASFGLELEQHWEAKASVGGDVWGGKVEASTGGSIKVTSNFGWQTNVSKEKMEGTSEQTQIPIPIAAGKSVKVFRKQIKQDMLIKTQLVGVLRPAFFVVDYKKGLGKLWDNKDIQKWRGTKSRIVMVMHDVDDLYNFLTGNNPRYPKQSENLIKTSKSVKEAYDFFDDKDNRSFVQNDERLMRDASATQIFLKEQ